jgi:hypothetical protein
MSITPTGTTRTRHTLLRQLATQAASHPRIEAAVIGAIRDVLPSVIEGLLRDAYGGETVRIYAPRHDVMRAEQDRQARDLRIAALAAAPSNLSPAAIAAQEGITPHRVRQILRAVAKGGNAGA